MHREQILEGLWPDLPAERGRRTFQTTLWALRRALDPDPARRGQELDPTTRPQPNTPSGSYFSFTRRTRSRLSPQ